MTKIILHLQVEIQQSRFKLAQKMKITYSIQVEMCTYAWNGPLIGVRSLDGNELKNEFLAVWILDLLSIVIQLPSSNDGISGVVRTPLAESTTSFETCTTNWILWHTVNHFVNSQWTSSVNTRQLVPVEDVPGIGWIGPLWLSHDSSRCEVNWFVLLESCWPAGFILWDIAALNIKFN